MKLKSTKLKKVNKFILDEPSEKEKYESIINEPKYVITKEQFAYDRLGRAIITIWYEEED